jgi:hypothetical protein
MHVRNIIAISETKFDLSVGFLDLKGLMMRCRDWFS